MEHWHLQYFVCYIIVFVLPLFDYCDAATTATFTAMLERVHTKFVKILPSSYHCKFSFTLMECHRRIHTAVQIFKSIHRKSPSYLHNIFCYSNINRVAKQKIVHFLIKAPNLVQHLLNSYCFILYMVPLKLPIISRSKSLKSKTNRKCTIKVL